MFILALKPTELGDTGTRPEMQRQLALQQGALNIKNPCQAASDIANYPVNKRIGEKARPIERRRLIGQNAALIRQLNPALTQAQAQSAAETAARGKDAIHMLDMVAGGNPVRFSGLGGASENRSIGSQWNGRNIAPLTHYA